MTGRLNADGQNVVAESVWIFVVGAPTRSPEHVGKRALEIKLKKSLRLRLLFTEDAVQERHNILIGRLCGSINTSSDAVDYSKFTKRRGRRTTVIEAVLG